MDMTTEQLLNLTDAALATETPAQIVGRFAAIMTESEFNDFTGFVFGEFHRIRKNVGSVAAALQIVRRDNPVCAMFIAGVVGMDAK